MATPHKKWTLHTRRETTGDISCGGATHENGLRVGHTKAKKERTTRRWWAGFYWTILFIGPPYALLLPTRLGLALGLGLGLGLLRRLCGGTRRLDRQCHLVLGRPVLVLAEASKLVASGILELEHVAYLGGAARRRQPSAQGSPWPYACGAFRPWGKWTYFTDYNVITEGIEIYLWVLLVSGGS